MVYVCRLAIDGPTLCRSFDVNDDEARAYFDKAARAPVPIGLFELQGDSVHCLRAETGLSAALVNANTDLLRKVHRVIEQSRIPKKTKG